MNSAPLIDCNSLQLSFPGKTLFEGLSFRVRRRERIGLTGRSGLGKSVLLEAIVRDAARERSAVMAKGQVNVGARQIGFLPQRAWLPRWFTVEAWVDRGIARVGPERRASAQKLIEQCGVRPLYSSHPRTLSGGESQRVSMVLALLFAGDLVVLDEPLSALDVVSRDEVMAASLEYLSAHGIGLLLVSHELDILCTLAQTIHVLGTAGVLRTIDLSTLSPSLQTLKSELLQTL